MPITVKQLIKKLEEIENKYLEVEMEINYRRVPVDIVYSSDKKIVLFTKKLRNEP